MTRFREARRAVRDGRVVRDSEWVTGDVKEMRDLDVDVSCRWACVSSAISALACSSSPPSPPLTALLHASHAPPVSVLSLLSAIIEHGSCTASCYLRELKRRTTAMLPVRIFHALHSSTSFISGIASYSHAFIHHGCFQQKHSDRPASRLECTGV